MLLKRFLKLSFSCRIINDKNQLWFKQIYKMIFISVFVVVVVEFGFVLQLETTIF